MSGKYLKELVSHLETPNSDGEPRSVYLNVISKSGTTLETALSFRVLREWMSERYEDISDRIICTTSPEASLSPSPAICRSGRVTAPPRVAAPS